MTSTFETYPCERFEHEINILYNWTRLNLLQVEQFIHDQHLEVPYYIDSPLTYYKIICHSTTDTQLQEFVRQFKDDLIF